MGDLYDTEELILRMHIYAGQPTYSKDKVAEVHINYLTCPRALHIGK